jgi:cytochrome bd ubiquinol oxidase subunit I
LAGGIAAIAGIASRSVGLALTCRPMKVAAIEAHWDGSGPAPLVLFAWPDERAETNRYAITIPHGASLVLTHSWNGLFPGLKSVPPSDPPPVVLPFCPFRIIIGIGLLMIAVAFTGAYLCWRTLLLEAHW